MQVVNMKILLELGGVAVCIALLQGCAWVNPTAWGAEVRVATPAEVAGCREAGSTQVSVLHYCGKPHSSQGPRFAGTPVPRF